MATTPGITDFIKDKPVWNKLVDSVYSSDMSIIKMNNVAFPVKDGAKVNTVQNATNNTVSSSIGAARVATVEGLNTAIGAGVSTITEYTAPTMLALQSMDNIGKEFDNYIKDTFIAQMFHIKGQEILCTAFCILVSFLPCETRQALYEAILDIQNASNALAQSARVANELVQTFNATMASAETVAQAAEGIFQGKQNIGQSLFGEQGSGQSVAHAASTIIASVSQVKKKIEELSKLLKIVAGAKINVPVDCNATIWNLANSVLFALQGMAVSLADKALSKIFNPIEQFIRHIQPQNCIGNLAGTFFNKLIDGIRRFKQWLLLLIAELFTANNNWSVTYKTFGYQMKSMLELIAFLDALKMIASHFGDLAIACGVTPCTDTPSPLRDTIRSGNLIDPTKNNVPAARINNAAPNFPSDNIDNLAKSLAPILGVPLNNIYVGPSNIQVSTPIAVGAPRQIKDLLNDPDIARELGPAFKLYVSPDNNNATVVYSFDRKCGSIKE